MKYIYGIGIKLLLTYLVFAFIGWDINPAHWHIVVRCFAVLFAFVINFTIVNN